MIYQLIHHDGYEFTFLVSSPELTTEAEKLEWYNSVSGNYELPVGRQWAVVDANHRWFTSEKKEEPSANVEVPLRIEEVQKRAKTFSIENRHARFARDKRLAEYVANFPG